MKKSLLIPLLIIVFAGFSSFEIHKFYMSIYQINFVPEKKMLQITSRIFVDDLNATLSKKFNHTTHFGEEKESENDLILMKKYLSEHFTIKVNGQLKNLAFLSKELDANVLVCYFKINGIPKIKTLEIRNTALLDLNSDQQNIIQTTIYGKKESLLLTNDNFTGTIKN
ncbi:MAG: hypothetical protein H7221_02425 [Flavobacterium sp.]|nr:hypothetical protein [Flavobacterium sp.]